jgi:plastocyanin
MDLQKCLGAGLLIGLLGCGDDSTGTGPIPPASASVQVGNVFYQSARNSSRNPAIDTVAINGTVTWEWAEAGDHAVTFDDPSLTDSPELIDAGSQYALTFPIEGTYTYDCLIHGAAMSGTVVVR